MEMQTTAEFKAIHEIVSEYAKERKTGMSGNWDSAKNIIRRVFWKVDGIDVNLWDKDVRQLHSIHEIMRTSLLKGGISESGIRDYLMYQQSHNVRVLKHKRYIVLYPTFVALTVALGSAALGPDLLTGGFGVLAIFLGAVALMDRVRLQEHESWMREICLVLRREIHSRRVQKATKKKPVPEPSCF